MLHCTNSGFYQTRTHKNDHKLPSSSTLTNNNIFLLNRITGLTSSHAGAYQKTLVGFGNFLIRTLIPTTISATPYCKALIVKLFFYQIIVLADTSSLSFSDLMTTVASYVFPEHGCHWEGGGNYYWNYLFQLLSRFQSAEFWIYKLFWEIYHNSRPGWAPCGYYLLYFPLCSLYYPSWWSRIGENIIYRLFFICHTILFLFHSPLDYWLLRQLIHQLL